MRTARESSRSCRALFVGAAAFEAIAALRQSLDAGRVRRLEAPIRVHSVFASTVNLEILGVEYLVTLSGARSIGYPHAIDLGPDIELVLSGLRPGDAGYLADSSILLDGRDGSVFIDLRRARRRALGVLVFVDRLGTAYEACASELEAFQARIACDLRLSRLSRAMRIDGTMGARLSDACAAVGAAAQAMTAACGPYGRNESASSLREAVASLLGMGGGLTPAGDDFLGGFLAAARCALAKHGEACKGVEASRIGADVSAALCDALRERLESTTEVSASLLRCALRSYWPEPLVALSAALAADRTCDALHALRELCDLGHSSGADIATGFLYGLRILSDAKNGSRFGLVG